MREVDNRVVVRYFNIVPKFLQCHLKVVVVTYTAILQLAFSPILGNHLWIRRRRCSIQPAVWIHHLSAAIMEICAEYHGILRRTSMETTRMNNFLK